MRAHKSRSIRRPAALAGRLAVALVAATLVAVPVAVMVATIVTSSSSYPAGLFLPPTPVTSANSDAAHTLIQNGCSVTDNRALLVF
jgi:hypothetical protein